MTTVRERMFEELRKIGQECDPARAVADRDAARDEAEALREQLAKAVKELAWTRRLHDSVLNECVRRRADLDALRSQLSGSQSALTMAMAELTECRSTLSALQAQHEQTHAQAAGMVERAAAICREARGTPPSESLHFVQGWVVACDALTVALSKNLAPDAGKVLLDRLERAEKAFNDACDTGARLHLELAAARAENAKLRETLNSIAAGMPGDRAGALARAALAPEAAVGGEAAKGRHAVDCWPEGPDQVGRCVCGVEAAKGGES